MNRLVIKSSILMHSVTLNVVSLIYKGTRYQD